MADDKGRETVEYAVRRIDGDGRRGIITGHWTLPESAEGWARTYLNGHHFTIIQRTVTTTEWVPVPAPPVGRREDEGETT